MEEEPPAEEPPAEEPKKPKRKRKKKLYFTEDHPYPDYLMQETMDFVPRKQWGALPPRSTEPVKHPVIFLRYQYTGNFDVCKSVEECSQYLRDMQKDHMETHNLPDIQYNFIIGVDGTVYEGRGWHACAYRPGKHDPVWRNNFINIGLIGNYEEAMPSMYMEVAAISLGQLGIDKGYVTKSKVELIVYSWRIGNFDYTRF